MSWIFFAMLAPFLFAVSTFIDKFVLERYFTEYKGQTLRIQEDSMSKAQDSSLKFGTELDEAELEP
jgi:hypothetical protein